MWSQILPLGFCALLVGCNEAADSPVPGSIAHASTAPTTGTTGDTVVATWEGGSLTYAELEAELGAQLVQLEAEYLNNRYQTEMAGAEQAVITKLLEEEAKAQGKPDVESYLEAEISNKTTAPTEAELRGFYEVMKRRLSGKPFELVQADLAEELTRRKQAELFQGLVDKLKANRNVQVTIPFPDLPRMPVTADDDPFLGPVDAPVTIIQFAEYQCAYCGKVGPTLDKIMEEYPDKVKIVFRDFPLGFHSDAIPAAIAANCAGEQGKYWEMHKLLMGNQRALDESTLVAHADSLGLKMGQWSKCREDPAQAAEVQKDQEDGARFGVTGTPAFFVNGIMLSGALPYDQFQTLIDRELAAK
jgi:protein-disulfide isomerase